MMLVIFIFQYIFVILFKVELILAGTYLSFQKHFVFFFIMAEYTQPSVNFSLVVGKRGSSR